jgi:iron complex transport system permease protein
MRNPLGSPDVMGFNTGAWSGVLVAMVLFGQNLTAIAWRRWPAGVDLAGGLAAGLAQRDRNLPPDHYRHRRARHAGGLQHLAAAARSLETALSAGLWNAGSLNGLTWGKTWPSAPLILLMLVAAALLVRRMRLLEMGDDTACALGVRVERSRLLLMLVAWC